MNPQDSSQAKTEPPTAKRLRDLRKKGDVARSPDVPATAAVIAAVVFMAVSGMHFLDGLNALLNRVLSADLRALESGQTLGVADWARNLMTDAAWLVLPLVLVLIAASLLSGFLQVGAIFSTTPVKPQLSRVNPVAGAKRLFSLRMLVELLKLLLKTVLLGGAIWLIAMRMLPTLLRTHYAHSGVILPLALHSIQLLAWASVACFLAIAAFDLYFQAWDYRRRNRMSIEEVRREVRETEGNPQLRQRRRQLHREVNEATMLESVRRAQVVVVNPTHIAVALHYQPGETDLPIVVAKGEGDMARQIRRIAEEEGIPVLHNVDLARRLQSGAPVGQYIPDELIEPVAAVLRWVRELGNGS